VYGLNLVKREINAYLVVTFILTWSAWLFVARSADTRTIVFAVGGPIFLLGVFAPGLVAIAFAGYADGRRGITRLLMRMVAAPPGSSLYLFAVGYMAAIKLAAALVHRLATGAWPRFGETPVIVMFAAILISMWAQAGEEVGWRGYALPRLVGQMGLGGASLVLGLIWAFWHLPLFFLPGSGSQGQSFPIYLLQVTAMSVAFGWLYWRSQGSLLLVMLFHAATNNTTDIVPAAVPGAMNPLSFHGSLVAWATVALSWLIAIVLLFRMRGATIDAMLASESRQNTRDDAR
jgi:membrane protease YdiL (CAAX protease family)